LLVANIDATAPASMNLRQVVLVLLRCLPNTYTELYHSFLMRIFVRQAHQTFAMDSQPVQQPANGASDAGELPARTKVRSDSISQQSETSQTAAE
jgi:hypothetical protein